MPLYEIDHDVSRRGTLYPGVDVLPRQLGEKRKNLSLERAFQQCLSFLSPCPKPPADAGLTRVVEVLFVHSGERAEEWVLRDIVSPVCQVQPTQVGHHPAASTEGLAEVVKDHSLLVVSVGVPLSRIGNIFFFQNAELSVPYQRKGGNR